MVRRVLGIVCTAALSVVLISCTQAAEPEGVGNTVVVVEEDSRSRNTPSTEASEEQVDEGLIYPSDETAPDKDEVETDDQVIAIESDLVIVDLSDSDYVKETPSMIQGVEVPLGDTSYRDNLEDEELVKLADQYFDEGYYVVDADTLAMNGATFSIDGDRHYFYRGFMAACNTETESEIRYYFIMTEDMLFAFINQYEGFASGYTDNGSVIEFSFRQEGMSLKYYKDTQLMEYVMSYSN